MLDGKQTLSDEQQKVELEKEIPTLESAFPCGTTFSVKSFRRDQVSYVDSHGDEIVLGQKNEDGSFPLQSFFITSLDEKGNDVTRKSKEGTSYSAHVYTHILLFSALSKSNKVGRVNVERTAAMKETIKEAILKGNFSAEVLDEKLRTNELRKEYDWHYERTYFAQMFWDIMTDWNATLHPEVSGYSTHSGRTWGAQGDRLMAFIGNNELISLRQVDETTVIDILPERNNPDFEGKGFTVEAYGGTVNHNKWLTIFARKCDWEAYKADPAKFMQDHPVKK